MAGDPVSADVAGAALKAAARIGSGFSGYLGREAPHPFAMGLREDGPPGFGSARL